MVKMSMKTGEHVFDCTGCGAEVDPAMPGVRNQKLISYFCLNCGKQFYKRDALLLMEKKDGRKRWSLVNQAKEMSEGEERRVAGMCITRKNAGDPVVIEVEFD